MHAVVIEEFGGSEKLKYYEVEDHPLGPSDIRIKQHAIGVNYIDTYHRSGLYPNKLPLIIGSEGAGEVTEIGSEVSEFKIGDRVAYQGVIGGYATSRILPWYKAVKLPAAISYDTAAAIMLKGLTAYYLIHETFKVTSETTLLWQAASGGVGLLATQWAKSKGATVIGTAGSAEKCARAIDNGCDHVINYTETDFAPAVRNYTEGAGVDVVYDGVGKSTFEASLDCLKPRGLMVSFGNATGVVEIPDLVVLSRKGSLYLTRPTTAHYFSTREDLLAGTDALFSAVLSNAITVHIGQRFFLADAAKAHDELESRNTFGSTLLIP